MQNFMKRLVLLFTFLYLAVSSARSSEDDHQFIPIPVLDNTVVVGRTHRAPAQIPIQAMYDGFTSSICVQFLRDLGDIEISIYNLFTGDCIEFDVDSSDGASILPISGDEGIYQITFLLESGHEYEGEFEIE